MSTYFAKFLPVEGEIKEGDYCYDKYFGFGKAIMDGELCFHIPREGNIGSITTPISRNLDDKRPYKLFLCSRDIQSGDKAYQEFGDKTISEEYDFPKVFDNWTWAYKNSVPNHTVHIDNLFKVIGEISKDAIWVKEGDELNEEQIEEWYWHLTQNCYAISVKFGEELFNKSHNSFENNKEVFKRGVFKIKCPTCKNFH